MTTPANWHPDPTGRYEYRYWDGNVWTAYVSTNGVSAHDPLEAAPQASRLDRFDAAVTVGNETDPAKVHEQLHGDGIRGAGIDAAASAAAGGGGTIFDEPILIVNQKAKVIELNNQYSVMDQRGTQLAAVNQVGQSALKKVARLVGSVDQFMTHRLEITDRAGRVLLRVTRPRKFIKSTVIVERPDGSEVGRIVQQNMVGKINFALEAQGHQIGAIRGENWRAWNFRIDDGGGNEIAHITKTFEGVAKTLFTTADNYVVQIHRRPSEPLNTLIVASALSVDTALKQDARGLG